MERRVIGPSAAAALAAVVVAGCGSPSAPGPVVEGPVVHSIAPNSGTMFGGTDVTIRGQRFAAGATVMIGERAATDVNVQSTEVITAKTPVGSRAGAADVVVVAGGRSGILPGGFTYLAPEPTNTTPPVIKSITAQGSRSGQPPNFADRGETLRITAVVEDAETEATQLQFEWKACDGTFTGTGAQVDWQAPSGPSPQPCTIELAVVERYLDIDPGGAPVQREHRVTSSIAVRVHDSAREIRDLALEFLTEFANSSIAPATTVRNFSDSCPGKASELEDVTANRQTYTMDSHTHGDATVGIAFGGVCAFRSRRADACVATPVQWRATNKATGKTDITVGTSFMTAVYEASRWWLCDSEFEGTSTSGLASMR